MLIRSVFSLEILEERPGFIHFQVTGRKAKEIFSREGGGHRWQRVPPTEKRGRKQTSTITVAVLEEHRETEFQLNESDLEETTTKGSGPGGQHRNKVETAVRLKHIPTGLMVKIESEKSQYRNKEIARSVLASKLFELEQSKVINNQNNLRKEQIGSGMRGDKIRTVQVQNDVVINHQTGKKISYKDYNKGKWSGLF